MRITGGIAITFGISAVFFALYASFSLLEHARLRTSGYDLGIFHQAVASYADFRPPISPLKGADYHLLGDHFHPILATLAPLHRIWPDAGSLLVAQAALIALSVLAVGRYAVRTLGAKGHAIAVAYGSSWGLQGLAAFDFHEVAFAVPLLAFATAALAEERWKAAAAWALPLLLVKEDMGFTVAAVGAYLAWKGRRGLGAGVAAAGAAAVPLTVLVLIPAFNRTGRYPYSGTELGLTDPVGKAALVGWLLLLTLGLCLTSPLVLIAVPSLGLRLLSDNPLYWSTGEVHYNAILMPVLFIAMTGGLAALRAARTRPARSPVDLAPYAVLLVALALLPSTPIGDCSWRADPRARAARGLLERIPDGATVAAGNNLVPQLTGRTTVVAFPDPSGRPYDWVALDLERRSNTPRTVGEQDAALAELPGRGFRRLASSGGVVLFHRPSAANRPAS
ncbi:DUF2079 domain-containing protein [Actinocorallia populi]|uniref:DUF2079 domain-containing protein n=1 Tax=Actinocorallia populi TaxID=2079200 RepID=UPI000D08C99C|nr:DUF2079 domain-containing protein [Actinocorallia populi]